MASKSKWQSKLAALGALALWSSSVQAQDVWQWDFENGDLSPTAGGGDLGLSGGAQGGTEFGTTTSFGIPDINGEPANVMQFPKTDFGDGYSFPGDLGTHDTWTLVLDVYYPAESAGKFRGVLDVLGATPGAEFGVDGANALWHLGRGSGTVQPGTWHRIAYVSDADNLQIRKYIDGSNVATGALLDLDLQGGAVTVDSLSLLFSDDSEGDVAQTETGFVNSLQFRAEALGDQQMRAIGPVSAAGIPVEIPPVPSFIVAWTPRGDVAPLDTAVGAVINQGDATIDQGSIVVTVDGEALAANIDQAGDVFTVSAQPDAPFGIGTSHTMTLTFTDDADGEKTWSRDFTAALFYEDFEGLELEDSVDEGLMAEAVWTRANAPEGWVVDDSGVPGAGDPLEDGVTEWAGWSFANKDWWVETAGDQRRSEFSRGDGTVAVSDPDEWDDAGHADSAENGWYDTSMTTPEISLEGVEANSLFLQFASSWRDEFDSSYQQSAEITASYDGGAPQQILLWLSDPSSPNFKDDVPNESIILDLENPAGAQTLVLNFRLFDAGNDWWWAIDNVTVNAGAKPPTVTLNPESQSVGVGGSVVFEVAAEGASSYQWFKNDEAIDGATSSTFTIQRATVDDAGQYSARAVNSAGAENSNPAILEVVDLPALAGSLIYQEDFEGLPLGPNVDEATVGEAVWTKTAPEGWTADDSGVPGAGDPETDGVTEWAGWGFATRAWWAETAGGQRREEFLRGSGTIAIADGDEWDDAPRDPGNMATFMTTPAISLDGIEPGSVQLRFDSSWRPEVIQTGTVTVSFDGGDPIDVVRLESESGSVNFKDHAPNDTITASIDNPAGASSMTLTFGYFDAGNNWWWAVDDIVVHGVIEAVFAEDFEGLTLGSSIDEEIAADDVWTNQPPAGWSIEGTVPGSDDETIGVREWEGWAFADREWWANTAGDQRRTEFLRGRGTVAIGDGDEWDDRGSPGDLGAMNTFLSTPAIDISGLEAGSLLLTFDSSWRPEDTQAANVTVSYDGGDALEVLRFSSDSNSPDFEGDEPNDTAEVALFNPDGAQSMVITFGYLEATNDWWWAIDNVLVKSVPGGVTPPLPPVPGGGGSVESVADNGDGTVTITYSGTLQGAATVTGPYAPVAGASSPYTIPAAGEGQFYIAR